MIKLEGTINKVKRHFGHTWKKYSGEKPFQCKVCLKRFTYTHTLNTHKIVHTDEKQFPCKICKKQVKSHFSVQFVKEGWQAMAH